MTPTWKPGCAGSKTAPRSEQVIRYATAADRRDWAMLGRCFTGPVHADFTEIGSGAADFTRDELVSWISGPEGNANAVAEARTASGRRAAARGLRRLGESRYAVPATPIR